MYEKFYGFKEKPFFAADKESLKVPQVQF